MQPKEVMQILKRTKAILKGHFLLSSGLHSDGYIQCACALQFPRYASKLAEALALRFKEKRIDVVIGPALGGIVLSYEVARALAARSIFAERRQGKMSLRRNFDIQPEEEVLVVEDVLTTGGSIRETIDLVKNRSAKIVGIGIIVDRSQGKIDLGFRLESLIQLQVKTYPANECPLCKQGVPLRKPGSR